MGSHAFLKSNRIRKRADFQAIQTKSRRLSLKHLTILFRTSPTGNRRLGIVASRKLGSAILRNRAKRLIREAFRLHPEWFAGTDMIVIMRSNPIDLHLCDVEDDLHRAHTRMERR